MVRSSASFLDNNLFSNFIHLMQPLEFATDLKTENSEFIKSEVKSSKCISNLRSGLSVQYLSKDSLYLIFWKKDIFLSGIIVEIKSCKYFSTTL